MIVNVETEELWRVLEEEQPLLSPREEFFQEMVKALRRGEEWKDLPAERKMTKAIIQERPLPKPFRFIRGMFERNGNHYTGEINLGLVIDFQRGNEEDLEDISKRMSTVKGIEWYPYDRGQGQVRAGRTLTEIEYKEECGQINIRTLDLDGSNRKMFKKEEFQEDILTLGSIVNAYINAGINSSVKRGVISSNPEGRIMLSPYRS